MSPPKASVARRQDETDWDPRIHVIEALRAGVLAADAHGRVLDCNLEAGRLLRRPPASVVGARLADVLLGDDELAAVLAAEGRGEVERVGSDGSVAVFEVRVSQVDRGPTRTVVLFQDVTALVHLRRDRDRLLQMAAVGEVLPTMLHELRNPLAAVMTMLELLVEEAEGQVQHDLHTVLSEVRRIVLSLQGIGGMQGRVASARHQAIDEAIEEAAEILRPTAARRGITLTSNVETMPLLPLAREVLKGVVFNLVRNSIDACAEGQRIEVRARLATNGDLELSVNDTGKGMSPEVLRRCTELFFTDKEAGSGVGLAICRQVVERAGGTLAIRSEPGRGTDVTLCIPTRTRGAPACPESRP